MKIKIKNLILCLTLLVSLLLTSCKKDGDILHNTTWNSAIAPYSYTLYFDSHNSFIMKIEYRLIHNISPVLLVGSYNYDNPIISLRRASSVEIKPSSFPWLEKEDIYGVLTDDNTIDFGSGSGGPVFRRNKE